MRSWIVGLVLACCAWSHGAPAQDLSVYSDSALADPDDLDSGFKNYSYANPPAPRPNFANANPVRTGTTSIAFTPQAFNAVSFAHETQAFAPAQYVGIRFYVHGGATGGQNLKLNIYDTLGTVVDSGALAGYVEAGAIAANAWRLAEVRFANPPISYAGSFVRIDIQDGGDGSAQQPVFIDDVALIAAVRPDPLFANGFEGDDQGAPGMLQFSSATSSSTTETGGAVSFTVSRVGGTLGTVGTTVALGGTATSPADYTTSALALSWANGDATTRTVTITPVADAIDEVPETVTLQLGAPAGGATLGAPSAATLTISDAELLFAPQYTTGTIKIYRRGPAGFALLNTATLANGTRPNAIAFAPDGKLWVVNEGAANAGSLLRYDRAAIVAGGAVAAEATIALASPPTCCLFDLAFFGDSAYVTQSDFDATDRILKYPIASLAVSGAPVPTPLTNASFDVPAGLEFDPQGRLWVSNNAFNTPANTSVVRIDTTTGAVDRSFTNVAVAGRAALIRPEGLAFDAFGSLWVGNNGEQTIVAYSAAQLAGAGGAVAPVHVIDASPGAPLVDGTFGGVAFDSLARLWANYQRSPFEVREYLVTSGNGGASYSSTLGQVLTSATTFPGFGGLAFWPVPPTLHRAIASAPVATIAVEQDVVVSGRTSDRYAWIDANGNPRSAALTHNTAFGGGSMREYTYRVGNATRTARVTDSPFSPGNSGGFGYIVSHLGGYENGVLDRCAGNVPVESPLSYAFIGEFQRLAVGRHHAVHRFTLEYPLYGCANDGGPVTFYPMAVTIDWFFATGRNNPLWAVTLDLSSAPAEAVRADSRSPYGELLFDGSATSAQHATIAGVAWGDGRGFTTTSSPVTYNASWTWNTPNAVPFVKLWTTAPDATMGTVQTQTKAQHDAGGYFGAVDWGDTNLTEPSGCFPARFGPIHEMPCDFNWPYQSLNYELNPNAPNSATNSTRLAWGTNFGFLGQNQFLVHGSASFGGPNPDTFADGHPYQNYSTYVVLDTHSSAPVEAQVAEIEAVQQTTFTSIPAGAVRVQGQAGPNDFTAVTYAPAGWDHVYGVWTIEVAANAADVNFSVGGGRSLKNPIVNVRNWNGTTLPGSVTFNGVPLVQDVDYFPSIIDDANELLITLNRTVSGATNRLVVAQ